jgi:hypothetical protein
MLIRICQEMLIPNTTEWPWFPGLAFGRDRKPDMRQMIIGSGFSEPPLPARSRPMVAADVLSGVLARAGLAR